MSCVASSFATDFFFLCQLLIFCFASSVLWLLCSSGRHGQNHSFSFTIAPFCVEVCGGGMQLVRPASACLLGSIVCSCIVISIPSLFVCHALFDKTASVPPSSCVELLTTTSLTFDRPIVVFRLAAVIVLSVLAGGAAGGLVACRFWGVAFASSCSTTRYSIVGPSSNIVVCTQLVRLESKF